MAEITPDPRAVPLPDPGAAPTIVVVADDLIWASRLLEAVRRAGGHAVRLGSEAELAVALAAAAVEDGADDAAVLSGAVVDVGGRRYDGVAMIHRIRAARLPVIAVAQHDDQVTRKRALSAGAGRVFSYDKFFRDGPRLIEAWLARGSAKGGP